MVRIIADVGSNFKGSMKEAEKYIDICQEIGADIVKFQTYDADSLFSVHHPAYNTIKENMFGIPSEWHQKLKNTADEHGIEFCTTPTAFEHVDSLEQTGITRYKIASGDLTFFPLLEKVGATGKPIILSTGMATLDEVETAVETIRKTGNEDISLLHCVSNYPPEFEDINLNAMVTLREKFNLPVGFSDHTNSDELSIAAVALGADIIEKHIVIARIQKTPDAPFAMTPVDFSILVSKIRNIEQAMGNGEKKPAEKEVEERFFARRGVIAAVDIKADTEITMDHLKCLRPADGTPAERIHEVTGHKAKKDILKDSPIKMEDLN